MIDPVRLARSRTASYAARLPSTLRFRLALFLRKISTPFSAAGKSSLPIENPKRNDFYLLKDRNNSILYDIEMKNYLLFGDSNTWGYRPASDGERFPFAQRIGGVLQNRLGDSARVIEEALNGRMAHWEDPLNPNKNGAKQLPIILETHRPIDFISIMLGTNDLKRYLNLNPIDSAMGVSHLIDTIRESQCGRNGVTPEILVIAPPQYVDTNQPFGRLFEGAVEKSKCFPSAYKEIANAQGVHFLDASKSATPPASGDGVHIDEIGSTAIGNAIANLIQENFK